MRLNDGELVDFPEVNFDKLRTICKGVVLIRRAMIAAYPSVGADDLLQIAMIHAERAHHTYKPPYNYASHIHRAADRAILSELRRLRGVGKPRPQVGNIFDLGDSVENKTESTLADCTHEKFAMVAYSYGQHLFKQPNARGQRFKHAQLAALGALRMDRRWSYRVMALLTDTPKMREALELAENPHFTTVEKYEQGNRRGVAKVLKGTRRFFESATALPDQHDD